MGEGPRLIVVVLLKLRLSCIIYCSLLSHHLCRKPLPFDLMERACSMAASLWPSLPFVPVLFDDGHSYLFYLPIQRGGTSATSFCRWPFSKKHFFYMTFGIWREFTLK